LVTCCVGTVFEKTRYWRKMEGRMVTEIWGRIRKWLLDDLKETRGRWKLKEEALDHTLWRTRCERGYGPVVKTGCGMNEWMNDYHTNSFCAKIVACHLKSFPASLYSQFMTYEQYFIHNLL
jgi:hypothetical protein